MEMPMEWIEWILQETARDGKTMTFMDSFLNRDLLTELRGHEIYALSKKICPWLMTNSFTNGILTKNVEYALDPNLDSVCFTISAHNRELYKKVHRGDHFEDAMKTFEIVMDEKTAKKIVEVHLVITKDNASYLKEWWDFFGQYEGVIRRISPLVGSYDNLPSRTAAADVSLDKQEEMVIDVAGAEGRMWTRELIPDMQPCNLWHNLAFDVEGYFLQCCNWSPPDEVNYGTIQDFIDEGRTLKEIWSERLANRMRNKLCRSCNMKHPDYKTRLSDMKIDVYRDS